MANVYVGTWKKYNNGSIEGKWISIDGKSYDEFVAECRKVHKDECDPEFMIQDYEEFPDGLGAGDWLSREEYDDIQKALRNESEEEEESSPYSIVDYSEKAIALLGDTKPIKDELRKLGGRFNPRLTCGAGWIFPKKMESRVRELIGGASVVAATNNEQKSDDDKKYKKCLEEFLGTLKLPSDVTYYKKYNVGAVMVGDKYYLLDKHSIENRFCWSDEGAQYEQYKQLTTNDELMREYFLNHNINEASEWARILRDENRRVFIAEGSNSRCSLVSPYYWWNADEYERKYPEVTKEQREELAKAEEWSVEQFKKRLHTYLKKYGTDKLQTWTYWADR